MSSTSTVGAESSGGSPGHQAVTGRSWISSGAISAVRCRPVSPPAVRWISSEHVSGASGRGRTQWAWIRASSHGGPSGSAESTIIVRLGWRPVRRLIVSAARSPTSGCCAITTRFITLVRAAICRPCRSPSSSTTRFGWAQIRPSSFSMSSIVRALREPAQHRLARARRLERLDPTDAARPRTDGDDLARLAFRQRPGGAA